MFANSHPTFSNALDVIFAVSTRSEIFIVAFEIRESWSSTLLLSNLRCPLVIEELRSENSIGRETAEITAISAPCNSAYSDVGGDSN